MKLSTLRTAPFVWLQWLITAKKAQFKPSYIILLMSSTHTHYPTEFSVVTHLTMQYELTLEEMENVTFFYLLKK